MREGRKGRKAEGRNRVSPERARIVSEAVKPLEKRGAEAAESGERRAEGRKKVRLVYHHLPIPFTTREIHLQHVQTRKDLIDLKCIFSRGRCNRMHCHDSSI